MGIPPPTSVVPSRWLSATEIAEYLGVAEDTVYRWTERKNLPAHRIGKLWKFKTEEVDAWVKGGNAGQQSPHNSGKK